MIERIIQAKGLKWDATLLDTKYGFQMKVR